MCNYVTLVITQAHNTHILCDIHVYAHGYMYVHVSCFSINYMFLILILVLYFNEFMYTLF